MKKSKYFYYFPRILQWCGYGIFPDHGEEPNYGSIKVFTYRLYSFCVFTFKVTYAVLQMFGIYDAWRDKRDANFMFLAFTMPGILIFSTCKFVVVRLNNRPFRSTMKMLEVDARRFRRDVDIEKRCGRLATVAFFLYFALVAATIASINIFNTERPRPLDMSANSTVYSIRRPPIPIRSPWNIQSFELFALYGAFTAMGNCFFGFANIVLDLLVVRVLAFTAGHFKMLSKLAENVGDDALATLVDGVQCPRKKATIAKVVEDFRTCDFSLRKKWIMTYFSGEEFNRAMTHHLIIVIRYHQLLIRITKQFQKTYAYGFLWQMCASFHVIAVVMAHSMQNAGDLFSLRFFNNMTYMTSVMWQLFIQTYSANEITVQALGVAEGAYNSPWYTVEKDNGRIRKLLTVLMQNAQRPLVLRAAYFIDVSNDLFVGVMRHSYEIFTLIQSLFSPKKLE